MSYKPDRGISYRLGMVLILLTSLLIINGSSYAQCPSGLTNYWKLDKWSGNIFSDSVGGADASCIMPNCPAFSPGIIGNGLSFDGKDYGINVPSAASFDWDASDSFSIEFWMKTDPESTCAGTQVVVGRNGGPTFGWWLGCFDGGVAGFELYEKDGVGASALGATDLTDGNWHYLVAVRDSSENMIRLYVDGVREAEQTASYSSGFSSAGAVLNIGWLDTGGGYHFAGVVDEVAVYNRALSEDEILAHYNSPPVPICGCYPGAVDTDGDGIPDCEDGCPNDPNKVNPGACGCGIADTDTDGDGIADCKDNCHRVYNPDQKDGNNNGIGDACEPAEGKTICSILGNDPKPSLLDQDIFMFHGIKGEQVTVQLKANPSEAGLRKRASLLLTAMIPRVLFIKTDNSELPNEITAKLPATGTYLIVVAEQPRIMRGVSYRGEYCLTLKARSETSQTLKPYRWVE